MGRLEANANVRWWRERKQQRGLARAEDKKKSTSNNSRGGEGDKGTAAEEVVGIERREGKGCEGNLTCRARINTKDVNRIG